MTEPDDELCRFDEAMGRMKAVAEAQEHVWLEETAAATPVHSWPPGPNTAHPSFEQQAPFVRRLMDEDRYMVHLPVHKPLWRFIAEPETDPTADGPKTVTLVVRKVATTLAPYVGDPYGYVWRVAVDESTNRWVSGDAWVETLPPEPFPWGRRRS